MAEEAVYTPYNWSMYVIALCSSLHQGQEMGLPAYKTRHTRMPFQRCLIWPPTMIPPQLENLHLALEHSLCLKPIEHGIAKLTCLREAIVLLESV